MNLSNKIIEIFKLAGNSNFTVNDKFSSFYFICNVSNFKDFDPISIADIINFIADTDTFRIELKIDNNDALILTNRNSQQFSEKVAQEKTIYEEEPVSFRLEIKKNGDSIHIYDYEKFQSFWQESSVVNILDLLAQNQNNDGNVEFKFLEPGIKDFNSKNIYFTSSGISHERTNNIEIYETCHFGNITDYNYTAHYFQLIKRPEKHNAISEKLDKISTTFCIISIFDITSIKDSKLHYKINGYKSFEGSIDIDNVDLNLNNIYFKIFEWIYSEKSGIADKIGLTRNILTLSLEQNSLVLADSVYLSIQSAFKAYLQANISKYIEIRNKIIDELGWVSQKSGEIVANFLSNYQKSIYTFLSFFISVFLLRFLKDQDNGSFSKEETIFSLAFLALSIIYLLFSKWNLTTEKKRLKRKYQNLKNRYVDLLESEDIDKILKKDEEFIYELAYIDEREKNYTNLWIATITILIIAIISISNYLSWSSIFEAFYKLAMSVSLFFLRSVKLMWFII